MSTNNEEGTSGETFVEDGQSEATAVLIDESNSDENQNAANGENSETTKSGEDVSDTATVTASNSPVNGTGEDKAVSKRAEKVGIVSSDKMTKTVVVRVDRVVKHPVYRKYIKRRKKFMAHDETGATIGDKVRIVETRPLSAQKRWRVIEIIQKAEK